jgi:hypothetical protein
VTHRAQSAQQEICFDRDDLVGLAIIARDAQIDSVATVATAHHEHSAVGGGHHYLVKCILAHHSPSSFSDSSFSQ